MTEEAENRIRRITSAIIMISPFNRIDFIFMWPLRANIERLAPCAKRATGIPFRFRARRRIFSGVSGKSLMQILIYRVVKLGMLLSLGKQQVMNIIGACWWLQWQNFKVDLKSNYNQRSFSFTVWVWTKENFQV